jgi:hypothetical protein
MTRRNRTSRRVQTFSSPSIRSDESAADIMLWRGSRGEASDMRMEAANGQIRIHGSSHGFPREQNQPLTLVK